MGLDYGLTRHTWLRTRWMSADEIDGVPYGLDILQVDVNARF
ncbi:MAG: putative porin [Gammaproteobacteria bacterium]